MNDDRHLCSSGRWLQQGPRWLKAPEDWKGVGFETLPSLMLGVKYYLPYKEWFRMLLLS